MKKLVVLSGSGISAESGISTFRGGGGMWNNYRVEDVASIDGWHRNPTVMLDFYNQMRKDLKGVEPNEAHRLLAELEKKFDVTVITQNVDNLHERAGSSLGDKGGPHNTQLRPHIVWFGEAVPHITAAASAVTKADILLIIGTSLQVYPAAGLVGYAPAGCKVFVIDPGEVSARGAVHIQDVATAGMRRFIGMI